MQVSQANPDAPVEEVFVFGRGERQIGIAAAASEGSVGGTDLTVRPILRVAEMLEVVPGLIAAQHSGSGKANQYFLRGINLDHGTDFTTYIDDVPLNFRTHGHGQGYLDVNGIIPETVEHIDYRKGPYRADMGDFALAGAAILTTVQRYEHPFATAEMGAYGWKRLVAGGSADVGGGAVTLVGQWKTYDGPWEVPEDLHHVSGYGKYTTETNFGALDISLSGYTGTWRPTEQIPERAIGHIFSQPRLPTVDCKDEFCAIDPTPSGLTTRFISSAVLTGDAWHANLYSQFYNWHMGSNPTFFLDDPVNGDQILQVDRRWIYGGMYETNFELTPTVSVKLGAEGRYDDIQKVGVYHTVAEMIIAPISLHNVQEGSAAAYGEATWQPLPDLRIMGGLRGDAYSFDVKAIDPGSLSGSKDASIFSPKVGIAYEATDYLELYGNWGQGFHSNDARGVTTITPPVAALAKGTGEEGGARLQFGQFNFTATYWWLDEDSELVFVGDSNSVEPKGSSARNGIELVLFWRPYDWLAIDGVWTHTNAKFLDSPGADSIPGALEQAAELGISGVWPEYEASMRIRYIGPYALIEDNSARAEADMLINLRAAWKPGPFTISLELLNALDHAGKDVVYLYPTRLPGEPADGIDGRLSRAEEPRTVRVGLKYTF